MKNFKLAEPKTLPQASALLAGANGRVALMAGGTDLLGEMKEGVRLPEMVVDLMTIPGLSYIRKDQNALRVGALTPVAELAEDPATARLFPGLSQAARSVASPQLRRMGTVGGNLCQRPRCWYYRTAETVCRKKGGSTCFASNGRNRYHAVLGGGLCHIVYPSDLAPMLAALEAQVTLFSSQGERTVPVEEFYALPSVNIRRENVLRADEILKEVTIPLPGPAFRSAYVKFKERGAWDFALVSAAIAGTFAGQAVSRLRLVMGGLAPVPWRMSAAEEAVRGKKLNEGLVRRAARASLAEARPLAENAYKVELAEVILSRAVLSLIS
jgi:xanthine dehydrogenase YagS FAD-binding subunit